MKDRLPAILNKVIDDLSGDKRPITQEVSENSNKLVYEYIRRLEELRYQQGIIVKYQP